MKVCINIELLGGIKICLVEKNQIYIHKKVGVVGGRFRRETGAKLVEMFS